MKERQKPASFLPATIGITGGVVLASFAFWFFKKQADLVNRGKTATYDSMILQSARKLSSPNSDQTMRFATYLGTHVAVGTIAGLTAVTMLRRKRPHDAWTVVVSTGGAMILNWVLKDLFRRQRPQDARFIRLPKSHSFPSGHSLMAAATFPILAHHLVEEHSPSVQFAAQTASGITIALVGFSRVYFGVHFPSDVLAGFAAGFGWLGLTSLSHTLIDRDRRREVLRWSKQDSNFKERP